MLVARCPINGIHFNHWILVDKLGHLNEISVEKCFFVRAPLHKNVLPSLLRLSHDCIRKSLDIALDILKERVESAPPHWIQLQSQTWPNVQDACNDVAAHYLRHNLANTFTGRDGLLTMILPGRLRRKYGRDRNSITDNEIIFRICLIAIAEFEAYSQYRLADMSDHFGVWEHLRR